MQEAIELVKKYDNREIPIKVLFYNLELLLEKEKEQIMNAHTEGYSNYDSEMTSIDYFNQTYNN